MAITKCIIRSVTIFIFLPLIEIAPRNTIKCTRSTLLHLIAIIVHEQQYHRQSRKVFLLSVVYRFYRSFFFCLLYSFVHSMVILFSRLSSSTFASSFSLSFDGNIFQRYTNARYWRIERESIYYHALHNTILVRCTCVRVCVCVSVFVHASRHCYLEHNEIYVYYQH